MVTWQNTLSSAALEKCWMGDNASIQMGISPSRSLSMAMPWADRASSTGTNLGRGDASDWMMTSDVAIGGSIFSERNQ